MSFHRLVLVPLALAFAASACTKEQNSKANAPDPTVESPESTSGANPDGSTEGAADHTGTTPGPDAIPAAPANPPTGSGMPAQ